MSDNRIAHTPSGTKVTLLYPIVAQGSTSQVVAYMVETSRKTKMSVSVEDLLIDGKPMNKMDTINIKPEQTVNSEKEETMKNTQVPAVEPIVEEIKKTKDSAIVVANMPEMQPPPIKRGRGRPPKKVVADSTVATHVVAQPATVTENAPKVKRSPGRPKKVVEATTVSAPTVAPTEPVTPVPVDPTPIKRGRGRPKKNKEVVAPTTDITPVVTEQPVTELAAEPVVAPKKRGPKPGSHRKSKVEVVVVSEVTPKRKRGRPPKNSQ